MQTRLSIIIILTLTSLGSGVAFGRAGGTVVIAATCEAPSHGLSFTPTGALIDNKEDRQVLSDRWLETGENDFERVLNHQTSQGASQSVAIKHGPPTSLVVGESVDIDDLATRFHPLRTSRRSPPFAAGSLWLP